MCRSGRQCVWGHEHTTEPKGVTRECPTPRATRAAVAKPLHTEYNCDSCGKRRGGAATMTGAHNSRQHGVLESFVPPKIEPLPGHDPRLTSPAPVTTRASDCTDGGDDEPSKAVSNASMSSSASLPIQRWPTESNCMAEPRRAKLTTDVRKQCQDVLVVALDVTCSGQPCHIVPNDMCFEVVPSISGKRCISRREVGTDTGSPSPRIRRPVLATWRRFEGTPRRRRRRRLWTALGSTRISNALPAMPFSV